MTLRHFGGKTPDPKTTWSCPSCGHEQDGPLKAGCQACGAGADARKVGLAPETVALIEAEKREDANRARKLPPQPEPIHTGIHLPSVAGAKAALDWMTATDRPLDQVVPWANSEDIQEAFMAGVAWAQGQAPQVRPGDIVLPHDAVLHTASSEEPLQPATLWIEYSPGGTLPLEQPILQTFLAALAFYRDNQLAYGGVPGQLSAAQVTELITRLSPQEQEP